MYNGCAAENVFVLSPHIERSSAPFVPRQPPRVSSTTQRSREKPRDSWCPLFASCGLSRLPVSRCPFPSKEKAAASGKEARIVRDTDAYSESKTLWLCAFSSVEASGSNRRCNKTKSGRRQQISSLHLLVSLTSSVSYDIGFIDALGKGIGKILSLLILSPPPPPNLLLRKAILWTDPLHDIYLCSEPQAQA